MAFGSGTGWYRRYTRFWGRDGDQAMAIAREGLRRFEEWNAAIEAWQAPLLESPERPAWFSMALFNELYILVDGGSAWEDGRMGEPSPPEGEGRFAFLECFDYPFYNTHDVLFYASWALLLLWPELERRSIRSLIESLPVADPREVQIQATGERGVRKEAWMAPHDLGAPDEDPWLELNAYHYQDPNRWKDLNAAFVLQVFRDAEVLGDPSMVEAAWPAITHALDRLAATDADGDGLPDHDGRADQTFDTWTMEGPSAYAGGLWLAALAAAERMAAQLGEAKAAEGYLGLRERATQSYREQLWNGRYLRYDGAERAHSDSIMAGQLTGQWWSDAVGLPAYLPFEDIETALATIVTSNVRGFAGGGLGAVNGMRPDGSVDLSSEQSQEVWPGVVYSLAAHLLLRGMDSEAWETAEGAVRTTYERGFWFRTPEAWDADGNFRASLYMRPLSIWAMEAALRSRE
jgi:non-lysosomal glucosylceramidase